MIFDIYDQYFNKVSNLLKASGKVQMISQNVRRIIAISTVFTKKIIPVIFH